MRKRICVLLIMAMLVSMCSVSAQTYAPKENMAPEIMMRTTFTDIPQGTSNVKQLQSLAALQIMTFSDHKLDLYRYMTEDEVLRVLYGMVGVLGKAQQLAETDTYRTWYGLGERDNSSHSDGLYLYAKQFGLISEEQFCSYYCTGALTRNVTALRYNVYLWMAKLFGIAPETDTSSLAAFSDANRIKQVDKPYFAALVNCFETFRQESLTLYYPVTREWFFHILTQLEPYFIKQMGYEKRSGTITGILQEDGQRQIIIETPSQERDVIAVPLDETQNQLPHDIAVLGTGSRQITACLTEGEEIGYYIQNGKVVFIVVKDALSKPLTNTEVELSGTLYYYDAAMRMAVLETASGYLSVFLADRVLMTESGRSVSVEDLHQYYGQSVQINAVMRYDYDLLLAKTCRIGG